MSGALVRLAAAYAGEHQGTDPDGLTHYVGNDVPREVLLAAGLTPVRLAGRPGSSELADQFCGSNIDEVSRSQLSRVLSGELSRAVGLVISGDCEGSVRLFLYLREIQRLEPFPAVPRFTFLDLVHLPSRTSAVYNLSRLDQFIAEMETWSGRRITDDELAEQARLGNELRALGEGVRQLRTADGGARLSGVEALQVFGAGFSMHPRVYRALLVELLESHLPRHDGVRVFVTGSSHDQLAAYQLIESHGATVVGEDHDWGALSIDSPVREVGDIRSALIDAYSRGAPASAGYGIAERAAYTTRAAVAAGAQLVVCWLRRGDDAPAWDVPAQRASLADAGIPMLALPAQPYGPPFEGQVDDLLDEALASVSAAAR